MSKATDEVRSLAEADERQEQATETLTDQLFKLERMALLAGMPEAADWLRENQHAALVWAEDERGTPIKVLAWIARERGWQVITCAVCGRAAVEVDHYHPYMQQHDRCGMHLR